MKPVWLFGPPGSGKSTISRHLQLRLSEQKHPAVLLDADDMRRGPMLDLGFSEADRTENVTRLAHFAFVLADRGALPIVSAVTPMHEMRMIARRLCNPLLVYLTGREERLWPDSSFETGQDGADIALNTKAVRISQCVESIVGALDRCGWLS